MARNPFIDNPEVVHQARRLFKRLSGWTGWLVVLVVIGLYAAGGIYTVGPAEIGLVKRFGAHIRSSEPGIHYRLPSPIESVMIVDQRSVRTEEIGFRSRQGLPSTLYPAQEEEALMLTGDFNIIRVEAIVQYDVVDTPTFAFEVADYRSVIRSAAQAIIREKVATRGVDEALTDKREEIASDIQSELQNLLNGYGTGMRIINVRLQEVTPPNDNVAAAFDDLNSAIQDKERTILDSRRYENDQMPRAQGQAQKILNEAEGYKQSRILQAEGDVSRFLAVLDRYQLGPGVTEARLYIETMEEILPNLHKIVLTEQAGGLLSLLNLETLLSRED